MATGARRWRHFRPGRGQRRPRLGGRNGRGASGSGERGREDEQVPGGHGHTGRRRPQGSGAWRRGRHGVLVGVPSAFRGRRGPGTRGRPRWSVRGGNGGQCVGNAVVSKGGTRWSVSVWRRGSVRVWNPSQRAVGGGGRAGCVSPPSRRERLRWAACPAAGGAGRASGGSSGPLNSGRGVSRWSLGGFGSSGAVEDTHSVIGGGSHSSECVWGVSSDQ